jgi:hypothetical protein
MLEDTIFTVVLLIHEHTAEYTPVKVKNLLHDQVVEVMPPKSVGPSKERVTYVPSLLKMHRSGFGGCAGAVADNTFTVVYTTVP